MHTPMPSSGTPVQLTLLSWPDSTPGEGGERREGKRREIVKEREDAHNEKQGKKERKR